MRARAAAAALLTLAASPALAQTPAIAQPPIAGTWKLNAETSGVQVPPDYIEIRQYRLHPDGYLVGRAA